MPKSYIVDASAFDTPSDVKPGVYSQDIFDKTKETIPQPETSLGQKIGNAAEYLPTVGAVVGGGLSMAAAPGTAGASLLGGSALAGLGAAAGKAGEQIVKRIVSDDAPKTPAEAAKQIGIEGASTAAINAIGGKIISSLTPSLKSAATQVMKGFAHLDERLSLKVLNDPNILTRAKPLEEAKKMFADFFDNNGFTYGPRAVKAATGKLGLSDNAEDTFILDTIDKIESLSAKASSTRPATVIQDALAARYAAKDAISRGVRSGNNGRVRMFLEGRNQIDDWLETKLPGFSNIRKEYEEAKIKQAFQPYLPLNKNGQTSILGVLTSIGAAVGTGAVNPIAGIATGVVSSPKLTGEAIKAVSKASQLGVGQGISEMAGSKIADKVLPKEVNMEIKDHPQLTEEEAKVIAEQGKAKKAK